MPRVANALNSLPGLGAPFPSIPPATQPFKSWHVDLTWEQPNRLSHGKYGSEVHACPRHVTLAPRADPCMCLFQKADNQAFPNGA